jgi:riboflavin transporter FmnP
MNTKKLALIIIFTALALSLSQIKIPAPYAPFLYYQIWEIPIMVAFILISPLAGTAVALMNTLFLFAIFPGELPTGPAYNLAAILSMQAGILITELIIKKIAKKQHTNETTLQYSKKWITTSTAMGIITRVLFMTVVLYFAIPQPAPIGFGFGQELTVSLLPAEAFFNATIAVYTIPFGYLIANTVKRYVKLNLNNGLKKPQPNPVVSS